MEERIINLQNSLQEQDIDAVILNGPQDVYYYTGTSQPCNLLVPKYGDPVLQVRRGWDFAVEETFLSLDCLIEGGGLKILEEKLTKQPFSVNNLGLTLDILPVKLYRRISEILSNCDIIDVSSLILQQRSVKDHEEIESIRKAGEIYEKVHEVILANLQPGMSELEIASLISYAIRTQEGEGIVRHRRWDAALHPEGVVVSTENTWKISGFAITITGKGLSAAFPQGASTTKISEGDLFIVDIPLNKYGYHADIARTYVVGEATPKQKEVFDKLLEIEDAVLSVLKKGVPAEEVYFAALEKAKELQVEDNFQGYGSMKGNYIGHGLGLEVDGVPTLMEGNKTVLEENMVLAVEPKLIFPGWGAVDIEDDVIIKENGCELISPLPRELFEVK